LSGGGRGSWATGGALHRLTGRPPAYHVRQLADAGLLANARSLPHRGPVEHLYVLTPKGVKLAAVLNELPDMV
jgi:hypothetical protein